jgi:oligoribonuclease (3'-5' exoribonuclease)
MGVCQVIITDKDLKPVDDGIERVVSVDKSLLDKYVSHLTIN